MISIITAVFNQRGMNQLFYEKLVEYTENPFELIIIDNNSTDGSREYFENKKFVKLIKNDGNYSYPFCQNQGIKAAKYDYLAFLNNDIIVCPG
jgi:glycosyltransferase involved in cell wall biosynthesis